MLSVRLLRTSHWEEVDTLVGLDIVTKVHNGFFFLLEKQGSAGFVEAIG